MKTVAGSFRYVSGVQSSHRDVVEFPQGYLTVRGTTVDIVAGRTRTLIILIEGAITVVPFATRIPHDLSIPGTSLIVYNDGHVDGPMTREAALEKLHLRSDQFATTIWPTLQADSRTGFYVGVNVGHSWGQGAVTYNEAAFDFGGFPTPNSITGSNNLNGAIGGVQIGYNWQLGTSWVTGWEADLQLADEKASKNFNFPDGVSSTGVFSLTAALNSKIIWFGTVRAQVGWLFNPTTMVYATGGLAYGRVSVSGSFSDSDCISSAVTACMWGFNRSATNVGWTGGGGVQGAVPSIPNWTWKIEYLHVDLGSISGSGFDSDFGGPFFYNAKFTDNILRFGLNWNLQLRRGVNRRLIPRWSQYWARVIPIRLANVRFWG